MFLVFIVYEVIFVLLNNVAHLLFSVDVSFLPCLFVMVPLVFHGSGKPFVPLCLTEEQ